MAHRKFNVTPSTVRDYLPDDARLVVHHLHAGNSTPDQRRIKGGKVSPYITHAYLVLKDTAKRKVFKAGEDARILANASAICAPHDNPNRALSYRIAAGRAMRAYYGRKGV